MTPSQHTGEHAEADTRRLVELLADLVAERGALEDGPLRVELAGAEAPEPGAAPPELREVLQAAFILGARWDGAADEAGRLRVARLAAAHGMLLDLAFQDPAAAPLLEAEAARCLRAVFELPARELLGQVDPPGALARLAGPPGRRVLRLRCGPGAPEALRPLLGRWPRHLELVLLPENAAARTELLGQGPALAGEAREAGVTLSVRGLPRPEPPGPGGLPESWALLLAGMREIFRRRPALCPFPFLMLRWSPAEPWRPCPLPEGPRVGAAGNPPPWNAGPMKALREAFYRGEPPTPCRRCLLRPRVLAALLGGPPAPPQDPRRSTHTDFSAV